MTLRHLKWRDIAPVAMGQELREWAIERTLDAARSEQRSASFDAADADADALEVFEFLGDALGRKYMARFAHNGFDAMRFVLLIREQDLREMDIPSGHRLFILDRVRSLDDAQRQRIRARSERRMRARRAPEIQSASGTQSVRKILSAPKTQSVCSAPKIQSAPKDGECPPK